MLRPSGNVQIIKMHTHRSQLLSALIVERRKTGKKKVSTNITHGGVLSPRKANGERKRERKKKEKLKSTAISATTAWPPVG
jgi:hypothetical protein